MECGLSDGGQDSEHNDMLFILEVLCTACSAEHLKNK